MIKRYYDFKNLIEKQKVLVVYGPRRVGKTTLLNNFLSKTKLKYKLDSGDNIKTRQILSSRNFSLILEYAAGYEPHLHLRNASRFSYVERNKGLK